MIMILIGGKAGVGKTTFARMVAKEVFEQGLIPVLLSFAGELKREAAESGFGKLEDPEGYRQYCQQRGAEMRVLSPDYWIKKFDDELEQYRTKEKELLNSNLKHWEHCIIVDDCRYKNEIEFGKKNNATNIFLLYGERDNPNKNKSWTSHESEVLATAIEETPEQFEDLYDYFVYNDDTIEDLEHKVKIGVPYWCSCHADENSGDKMKELSKVVSEMLDLIIFNNLEDLEAESDLNEGAD